MRRIKTVFWWLMLALGIGLFASAPRNARPTAATPPPPSGLVCTSNASATFTLTTRSDYISLPDGNLIFMWSFSEGSNAFQFPGPVLCVNEGDTVTIVLNNTLNVPVSLIFPGQTAVLANNAPAQPQFSGATLTSLTNAAPAGGSMTYRFVASNPGTYLYESGTNAALQVQMGLFGALIVRPALGANYAYNRADTQFAAGQEYLLLLSEIDPSLHTAIENGQTYNLANYRARYWQINGRSFPDTIAPNGATWLPEQPYGALAHIRPYHPTDNPLPALMRFLSVGTEDYPFHPHGNSARIIARDGQLLESGSLQDLSYEKFSIPVGPGQTWDATFDWRDAEAWDPTSNPVPVVIPRDQNLTFGPYYGSPYLGNQDPLPPGTESYNQCGEYYHVAHNHALQQITSWGMTMSGMMTYTRIDPPVCP